MKPLSSCGENRACSAPVHVDWTNLGDGPAGRIAELALASDVADYVRFRAVCRPWRRCSPDPRAGAGLDGRFLPRQWIMLDKALTGARRYPFLNISTGECIWVDIPELPEHILLAVTPEGLLLLLHEPTLVVHLLNPLTGKLTGFPPLTSLLTSEQQLSRRCGDRIGERFTVTGAGLVVHRSMLAITSVHPMLLAVAEPSCESWTVVEDGFITSTATFGGQFYCTNDSGVMMLDTTGSDQQPPRLRVVVDRSRALIFFNAIEHGLHLMDNGGELMLVHRIAFLNMNDMSFKRKYGVSRVDLNAGILIPVKSFNGRAVFMGMRGAVSISAETFPSVTADTLYMSIGWDAKREMDRYYLADGSIVPCHDNMSSVHPCTLVDCLCSCVRGSFMPENRYRRS
ncbi:hypothetical protein EJB05_11677, partial [Eragrostis curvula]